MDTNSFDSSAIEIHSYSGVLPKIIQKRKFVKNDSLVIIPIRDYWEPFDTVKITIKGYVKGKNGLTLDGNRNGIPEGSPIDDYTFEFYTSDYGFLPVLKDSFPFFYPINTYMNWNNPGTVADVNKDGCYEIITTWKEAGSGGQEIAVIDKDAHFLSNFPQFIESRCENGLYPPAIADLDQDGYFEIIPNASRSSSPHTVYFYIFSHAGDSFPNWPQIYTDDSIYFFPPLHTTVAVYDLDRDNELEIIFPVRPSYIFIFEKVYGMSLQ